MANKSEVTPRFIKAAAAHYESMGKSGGMGGSTNRSGGLTFASRETTTRPEFNKDDYYSLRPNEAIPNDINDIMALCEDVYKNTGILRSIIDLITEFITDGLQILHTDTEIQNFYTAWMKKVDLQNRAERFASDLYKSGNVVLRRYTGKIQKKEYNNWRQEIIVASDEMKFGKNTYPDIERSEIPVEYFFFRPSSIYLVGNHAGSLSSKKLYGLKIPSSFLTELKTAKSPLEEKVLSKLPKDIKKSVDSNSYSPYIIYPLKNSDVYLAHYKKDDYDPWATPLIYSVLEDIICNKKLKQAKISGYDGFYNYIRIWKLGDHTKEILPTKTAGDKLNEIISNNVGGGGADIIWDSMIDVKEIYPPIEKLKDLKENNDPILSCFSIPQEITGGAMEGSQGSNTALRMKNFAKKLNYGRKELKKWIEFEIDIIHRNMKMPTKPVVKFKNDDLLDEKIYYTLLRELVDRGVLSDQTMLEKIEEIPSIEQNRIENETKLRDSGKLPAKASPFHNANIQPQAEADIMVEKKTNTGDSTKKPVGVTRPGRPSGAKDTVPRRRGTTTKRSFAIAYASDTYDKIDKYITELFLTSYKLPDVRSMNKDQKDLLDKLRTYTFANIDPGTKITDDVIEANMQFDTEIMEKFDNEYEAVLEGIASENITVNQKRALKIEAYCRIWCDESEN